MAELAGVRMGDLDRLWPLPEDQVELLSEARAEYRTLHHCERRPAPIANGFHMAITRGEDPRQDEDLVGMQVVWAAQYLFHTATLSAIELALGADRYAALRDDMIPSDPVLGMPVPHGIKLDKDVDLWMPCVRRWLECLGIRVAR